MHFANVIKTFLRKGKGRQVEYLRGLLPMQYTKYNNQDFLKNFLLNRVGIAAKQKLPE